MGKSSIKGPFSMAMLNNQRVNPINYQHSILIIKSLIITIKSHDTPEIPLNSPFDIPIPSISGESSQE